MVVNDSTTDPLASANVASNMVVDLPATDPESAEHTVDNQVVDRPSSSPAASDVQALVAALMARSDPNISDRQPPRPQDMVKPSISNGQKFYVVTCGRTVGICNLLWVTLIIPGHELIFSFQVCCLQIPTRCIWRFSV